MRHMGGLWAAHMRRGTDSAGGVGSGVAGGGHADGVRAAAKGGEGAGEQSTRKRGRGWRVGPDRHRIHRLLVRRDPRDLQCQAAAAAAWSSHPLPPSDRLLLAEALVSRAGEVSTASFDYAASICDLYRGLLEPGSLFQAQSDGTARCAVVRVASMEAMPAAVGEVAALGLAGYACEVHRQAQLPGMGSRCNLARVARFR